MTELLNRHLNYLNGYLTLVQNSLEDVDDNNFDNKMYKISILVKKIEEERIFLRNNFDLETLKSNCDVANRAVKQIFSQFDSIIESKKGQQREISSELSKIINKKKLINYQR